MGRNSCNSPFSASIPFDFLIALLNTSINLSSNPFDLAWLCADFRWFIERKLHIFSNSFDVNGVLLSDTMVPSNLNLANSSCNTFIVVLVIGVLHLKTSGYFVKLSTITKKYIPFIGLVYHGLSALGHGLNFMGGAFATDAQLLHDFTLFSMS